MLRRSVMANVTVLPLADYSAGTATIPPTSIPDGVSQMTIAVARCTAAAPATWPSATGQITIVLETSVPGDSQQWRPWVNASGTGGAAHNKFGGEIPTMYA